MKKRNGSGSRRLVEMTTKFQRSQHKLLDTLSGKGLIGSAEMKRMSTAVDRAVAQKRSSDVLSTAVTIHNRVIKSLDQSLEDAPEQREALEIEILLQLSAVLHSVSNERDVFDRALELLNKGVSFESATLFLFDREDETLEPVATRGGRVDLIDGVRFDMGSGLSAWVAKKKKPILISELARPAKPNGPIIRSFVSMPIVVQGMLIGVLNLSHSQPRIFTEDDLRLLRLFSGQLSAALERVHTHRELRKQSVCDRLTGLYNRRHFQDRLAAEIDRARRTYQTFSLLFVDVDDMEAFNNRYGHQAGDRVLVEVGKVLSRWCRSSDIVARYGGEEFCLLMPATGPEEAAVAAERLRKTIETHSFPQKRRVTVSLGAASYPEDSVSDLDLVAKAEQALFMAKKNGPNQSVAFQTLAVH